MKKRILVAALVFGAGLIYGGAVSFSSIGRTDRSTNTGVGTHWVSATITASGWRFVSKSKQPASSTWSVNTATSKQLSVVVPRKAAAAFTLSLTARAEPEGGEGGEAVYSIANVSKSIGKLEYTLKPIPAVSIGEESQPTKFLENGNSLSAYWRAAKTSESTSGVPWGTVAYPEYRFSSGTHGDYTIYGKLDEAEADTPIRNVQVKSIKLGTVESTQTNASSAPSFFMKAQTEKLALSATPEPGNTFPATKPIWMSGNPSTEANPEQRGETYSLDVSSVGKIDVNCGYQTVDRRRMNVNVCSLDLGIDSNNDGVINAADDTIETKTPGKICPVNDGDEDGDGVPDYADGYINSAGGTSEANSSAAFVSLQITIPKYLWDFKEQLKLKFTYEASSPSGATRSGAGTASEPFTYSLPADGFLRLWKKDGGVARNAASVAADGDYIPDGAEIPLAKLFPTAPTQMQYPLWTATVYVEAVKAGTGDIKLELVAAGQPDSIVADTVKVSAYSFDVDTDSNGDGVLAVDDDYEDANELYAPITLNGVEDRDGDQIPDNVDYNIQSAEYNENVFKEVKIRIGGMCSKFFSARFKSSFV